MNKKSEIASAQVRVKPSVRKKLRQLAAEKGITIASLIEELLDK